jgi:hypothetical protein
MCDIGVALSHSDSDELVSRFYQGIVTPPGYNNNKMAFGYFRQSATSRDELGQNLDMCMSSGDVTSRMTSRLAANCCGIFLKTLPTGPRGVFQPQSFRHSSSRFGSATDVLLTSTGPGDFRLAPRDK